MRSRGGVALGKDEQRWAGLLHTKERQRQDIPAHLFEKGNFLFVLPPDTGDPLTYTTKLLNALICYAPEEKEDQLVLYIPGCFRSNGWIIATKIERALRILRAKEIAHYTIDWWYRPVGLGQDQVLVALRPVGLYELTTDPP